MGERDWTFCGGVGPMIPATPRLRMSAKRRAHIFSEHATAPTIAPCCVCGQPIHKQRDRWIVEHVRALGLLGPDLNTNCAPAHYACAVEKTRDDISRITKAKRQSRAGKPKSRWKPENARFDWKRGRYVIKPEGESA